MPNAELPIQNRFRTTEQWEACNHEQLPAATPDDGPILMGTGGRRATREELIEFLEQERERIARERDAAAREQPPIGSPPLAPGAPAEERWAYFASRAAPPSEDDTPVLAGAGRAATREELLAFVAAEQARIARGG